jgi:signal transduction histidine kinase
MAKLLRTTTFRWLAAYMLVFLIAASGIIGYLYWHTNDLLMRQVVQTLTAEVTGLREQYRAGGAERLSAAVQERASETEGGLYLLSTADGRRLSGNLIAVPREVKATPSGALFSYDRTASSGPPGPRTRVAAGVAVDVPDGLTLVVARDVQDQRTFADTLRGTLLWSLGLLALFGLGGGLLASLGIARRIDAVSGTARSIMAGNLSQRIPLNGSGDEFDRLSVNLNAMLERMEQLMAGMREVSDNIAHDLKTPLSRMRNRLEATLREPDDGQRYGRALEQTIEDSDALVRTFNAMLAIARLESGAASEPMAPVDISALVAEAAELYEPVAEEAGFTLDVTVDSGLGVQGNQPLISQALANLIENALKYGAGLDAAARAISVSASREGAEVVIAVADRGPGIVPADRERALERFVRLDASRTTSGSGLGLSLVAAVARLHGGTVELGDNSPGLVVTVRLPT